MGRFSRPAESLGFCVSAQKGLEPSAIELEQDSSVHHKYVVLLVRSAVEDDGGQSGIALETFR
jgi:hypothetical protein